MTNSLTSLKNILGEKISIPFVQEVIAFQKTVEKFIPQTDTVVEPGDEDARITYLGNFLLRKFI